MADKSADEVRALADRVERLVYNPRNPTRFHEDKSDIAYELRETARRIR